MKRFKKDCAWITIFLLSIIPIIIWAFTSKLISPIASFQNFLISLGEIFGLVGIVMFSLNIILTTRLKFIEKMFDGLNKVYEKHNVIGQTAFMLLVFHPLLLLPRYSSSLKEVFPFLFLGNIWSRNFGIIALWMMIVLIILTLYLRPRYNIWKITHKFFGVALFLGALHAYLIPGYVMKNVVLKIYVLSFAIIGIIAFLYRSVFDRFLVKRYNYLVEDIKNINEDVIEISLKPKGKKIDFNPGQFIFIDFKQKEISSESHPFSISSAPSEELLKITVKNLGDYTATLCSCLKKGTSAKIEGAFGVFSYDKLENKKQVWIAGGIGITPFISFAKDLVRNNPYHSIQLFYCLKNKEEAVYLDLLNNLSQESNYKLKIIAFYSEEKGHISYEYIRNRVEDLEKKDIFICAPQRMIQELRSDFIKNDICESMIHSEEFNF